ncbi:hypothetical protein EHR05_10660 [Leptospira licerasiae]|nr:hypothetical protein EHR05_10660 [Leptospira licerasiae]
MRFVTASNCRLWRYASGRFRALAPGFATFASVTSFAEQTRAIANVAKAWSLYAIPYNLSF